MNLFKKTLASIKSYFGSRNNLIHFVVIVSLSLISLSFIEKKWFSPPAGNEEHPAWTCSMHPQIILPKAAPCPICGMDLIPLQAGSVQGSQVALSASERELARVRTVVARRGPVKKKIYLSGQVRIDATREGKISARFPGRIERMHINYPGVSVRKGDHLYDIYSPEIYQAQLALVRSLENYQKAQAGGNQALTRTARATYRSSAQRLKLLGLTSFQLRALERSKRARERVTIYSPSAGVVITKAVKEGDYVKEGSVLYQISDLSKVWVIFDAYEKDIPWVRYGEWVHVRFEALPGEDFSARIAYIDPVLDEKSRTVKVRVNFDNPSLALKPGMFAEGEIEIVLAGQGRIVDASLAGKYISPMHPEIIKDKPGTCDVCGMALIKTEELGYVSEDELREEKILLPKTAVLRTGRRALVYIEKPQAGKFVYEAKPVLLGVETDTSIAIEKGLQEGDRVVVEGVFKIDASMQITAGDSMMSGNTQTEVGREILWDTHDPVFKTYIEASSHLAFDRYNAALEKIREMEALPLPLEKDTAFFESLSLRIKAAAAAENMEKLRETFRPLSQKMIELGQRLTELDDAYQVFYCPMNTSSGSYWIDTTETVQNPFYGSQMFSCGERKGRLNAFLSLEKIGSR